MRGVVGYGVLLLSGLFVLPSLWAQEMPETKYLQYRNGLNLFLVVSDGDEDWEAFSQAKLHRDTWTIVGMIANGKVLEVLGGTRVEIIRSGLVSRKVRVLQGPKKDRTGWIEVEYLTDKPPPQPQPTEEAGRKEETKGETTPRTGEDTAKKKPDEPPSDDKRAATLLRSATNLERAGKKEGALSLYRQIVKDFPKTDAAKSANERIKAIGP